MPIPYRFIEVEPAAAVHDTPMSRDGSSKEGRKSGEILLTLEALTPLIVGNHHNKIDDKHSEIAPERLPDEHGRVLIAGSSIKGMLRHAIGSLLNSPMERVLNRHYTYRPNLGAGQRKKVQPAVVLKVPNASGEGLEIALLNLLNEVVFVRDDAYREIQHHIHNDRIKDSFSGLTLDSNNFRKRLERSLSGKIKLAHTLLKYVGGIDGEGNLARAFKDTAGIYRHVLYPTDLLEEARQNPVAVQAEVVRQYLATQEILADESSGHLAPGHPLLSKLNKTEVKRAIHQNTPLQPTQLIYVEFDTDTQQVTSFGHHYQYRWAYTSSTLEKAGNKRNELDWLKEVESKDLTGCPQQLAATRLLFGYAVVGNQSPLAAGNWKRMAGRISPNTAIEVIESGRERFLNGGKPTTLKVLGMPRPSAVEFYLKQPKGEISKLTTYGDLPGDPGGDLAGRKVYRHQPDATKDAKVYSPVAQQDNSNNERGTEVHAISTPGTQFRFTVRFDQLRDWELGALIATLEPARLARRIGAAPAQFAHKLGYGKPLGLGSVKLNVDKLRYRENDGWTWQPVSDLDEFCKRHLAALMQKTDVAAIKRWLSNYCYPKSGRCAYPTATYNKSESIFSFHTDLRKAHANARRGITDKKIFNQLNQILKDNRD